jgi:hypothetical protein
VKRCHIAHHQINFIMVQSMISNRRNAKHPKRKPAANLMAESSLSIDAAAGTFEAPPPGKAYPKYLTRKQAAQFLTEEGFPIAVSTLSSMASRGGGPAYQLFNGKAMYEPRKLLEWATGVMKYPGHSTSF